jgi:hypothetical protein
MQGRGGLLAMARGIRHLGHQCYQHSMTHADHFKALCSLVGQWVGQADDERTLRVRYSLHANDSVLMEHWQLRQFDALTLYHLDGETLMATHYCPLCNQPRLNLVQTKDSQFSFAFVGATNLKTTDDEHQHGFEIKLIDATRFWRSESYISADLLTTEAISYTRA